MKGSLPSPGPRGRCQRPFLHLRAETLSGPPLDSRAAEWNRLQALLRESLVPSPGSWFRDALVPRPGRVFPGEWGARQSRQELPTGGRRTDLLVREVGEERPGGRRGPLMLESRYNRSSLPVPIPRPPVSRRPKISPSRGPRTDGPMPSFQEASRRGQSPREVTTGEVEFYHRTAR